MSFVNSTSIVTIALWSCNDKKLYKVNTNVALNGKVRTDFKCEKLVITPAATTGTLRKFFNASSTVEVGGSPNKVAATFLSIQDNWATCKNKEKIILKKTCIQYASLQIFNEISLNAFSKKEILPNLTDKYEYK